VNGGVRYKRETYNGGVPKTKETRHMGDHMLVQISTFLKIKKIMTLKEQINADFMVAFKNKEMDKKNFLGVVKGEIQNEEGRSGTVTDEVVLPILKKMEKSLIQTNSPESLKELEYIKPYLPQMMSEELIREKVISYVNSGINNIGQIMGEFNKHYKGLVDNKLVSQITKEILN
jgi:uncharacterized protein YqeY